MNRSLRTALFALILVPSAALAGGTPQPAKQKADLIVRGGTLLTMAGPNVENGAVAIKGSAIAAVGTSRDIEAAWTATEVIDARGGAILPGFVNAHTHVPMTLFRGIADDRDLMDWLQNFIFPAEAKNVDREFVRVGTRLAAAEMIASGTTTFADMYYFEADIAREAKAAGLRCVAGETLIDFPAPDNKTWADGMAYMKKFADEFKGDPLVVAAIAPHAPYTVSTEHLREVRAFATANQTPILIHVSETTDELTQVGKAHDGKTPGDYLESIGFLGDDVIAAHGVWLTRGEAETFAKRGTSVVHCPESNMMLASGLAPLGVFAAAGVDIGLGTDGPAGSNNNLDMIEEMASAARLQKVLRKDPKALSARAVLELATIGGAKALNLADKIGTIESGKRADIIVVDLSSASVRPIYSIESAIVYAASGDDVTTTIVDGKVLMKDRKIKTVDAKKASAEADAIRDKVLASLKK
ncbi:MAG: amidohydrolase [Acidobacteria bacterium]|nr:amidohydrolase [Acidobacteriota bacterium]